MCGRYYVGEALEEIWTGIAMPPDREIKPTDKAPVLTKQGSRFMRWGFNTQKAPVINVRCETAAQKLMFSESLKKTRCIIPACGFFEWRGKTKYRIHMERDILYMAGFYAFRECEERFVILTGQAEFGMERIHDRMPILLPEKDIRGAWLDGKVDPLEVSGIVKPRIVIEAEGPEQLMMDFF